jgi:hypothetical protein
MRIKRRRRVKSSEGVVREARVAVSSEGAGEKVRVEREGGRRERRVAVRVE